MSEVFPLLDLSRDLLQLVLEHLKSHYDKRNYMITCKRIYNSIPSYIRRQHLFDLSVVSKHYQSALSATGGKGKYFCYKCRSHYKRKHKPCKGLTQCFRCWGLFRENAHIRECTWVKNSSFNCAPQSSSFWRD